MFLRSVYSPRAVTFLPLSLQDQAHRWAHLKASCKGFNGSNFHSFDSGRISVITRGSESDDSSERMNKIQKYQH